MDSKYNTRLPLGRNINVKIRWFICCNVDPTLWCGRLTVWRVSWDFVADKTVCWSQPFQRTIETNFFKGYWPFYNYRFNRYCNLFACFIINQIRRSTLLKIRSINYAAVWIYYINCLWLSR